MELSAVADEACLCCGGRPLRTASELCDRGLRRNRLAPLALAGAPLRNDEGLAVRFSLRCDGEAIADVRFQASTCATLLAYCELIAELATPRSIADGAALTPELIVAELTDVPPLKRDRAVLAVAAFRSALAAASHCQSHHPESRGAV